MIPPLDAFLQWFDGLPMTLREYLAHMFRICTTDDTSQMVALPRQSLERFRYWAVQSDFPLRVAARLFHIRAIFDMMILHHKELRRGNALFPAPDETHNIIPLSSRQWEESLESWMHLRSREMSDTYVHSWTSWVISQDDN